MTKPTKPTAVAGPTLDDAANPQVFSEKTFAWVNYTPEAVQYMADSNDYVEGVAATVDADATAVETSRQEVATNKAAVDTTKGQIDTIKAQIDLQEAAVVASTGLDVSAFNIGDLLQVVDDGAGGKELAMSAQRLENSIAFSGTTPSLNIANDQYFHGTLTGNTTFTFSVADFGALSGNAIFFVLEITQDSTARTITFPASVEWNGGTPPDAPEANATAVYVFTTRDGGTTWRGVQSGAAFS